MKAPSSGSFLLVGLVLLLMVMGVVGGLWRIDCSYCNGEGAIYETSASHHKRVADCPECHGDRMTVGRRLLLIIRGR